MVKGVPNGAGLGIQIEFVVVAAVFIVPMDVDITLLPGSYGQGLQRRRRRRHDRPGMRQRDGGVVGGQRTVRTELYQLSKSYSYSIGTHVRIGKCQNMKVSEFIQN